MSALAEPRTHRPDGAVAANLALDEAVNRRLAAGEPIVHLGFGESRLPLHDGLLDALRAGATRHDYGPVAGDLAVCDAVAGYFGRRRLPTAAADVVLAPGSKALLMAVVASLPGDVVLPRPAWVTYAPQARLFGRGVVPVDVPAGSGGVPDPDLLPAALAAARADGLDPAILVMTLPDNPTGALAAPDVVRRVCAVAADHGLVVVSDEIYRDVVFAADADVPGGGDLESPAELLGDRVVVATGLSKSLSLGGWRIGAARFPATAWGAGLRRRVLAVGSQTWSSLATPMQSVATYAFSEPANLVAYRRRATAVHAAITRALHDVVVGAGAQAPVPGGGFYVYPDLAPLGAGLAALGVHSSASLQEHLLERHGVAVLGGHAFGDDPAALRFRAATSLLSGATGEEQQVVFAAEDPAGVPHVAAALAQVARALASLA